MLPREGLTLLRRYRTSVLHEKSFPKHHHCAQAATGTHWVGHRKGPFDGLHSLPTHSLWDTPTPVFLFFLFSTCESLSTTHTVCIFFTFTIQCLSFAHTNCCDLTITACLRCCCTVESHGHAIALMHEQHIQGHHSCQ